MEETNPDILLVIDYLCIDRKSWNKSNGEKRLTLFLECYHEKRDYQRQKYPTPSAAKFVDIQAFRQKSRHVFEILEERIAQQKGKRQAIQTAMAEALATPLKEDTQWIHVPATLEPKPEIKREQDPKILRHLQQFNIDSVNWSTKPPLTQLMIAEHHSNVAIQHFKAAHSDLATNTEKQQNYRKQIKYHQKIARYLELRCWQNLSTPQDAKQMLADTWQQAYQEVDHLWTDHSATAIKHHQLFREFRYEMPYKSVERFAAWLFACLKSPLLRDLLLPSPHDQHYLQRLAEAINKKYQDPAIASLIPLASVHDFFYAQYQKNARLEFQDEIKQCLGMQCSPSDLTKLQPLLEEDLQQLRGYFNQQGNTSSLSILTPTPLDETCNSLSSTSSNNQIDDTPSTGEEQPKCQQWVLYQPKPPVGRIHYSGTWPLVNDRFLALSFNAMRYQEPPQSRLDTLP